MQNVVVLAQTVVDKCHPKPSEAVFSTVFRYNFRPKLVTDVISGVAIENVIVDVPVKFGDYRSNGFQDIGGANFVSNERMNRTKPIPIV